MELVLTEDAMQLYYSAFAGGFFAYLLLFMLKLFLGNRW